MNNLQLLRKAVDPRWIAFQAQRRIRGPQLRDRIATAVSQFHPTQSHASQLNAASAAALDRDGLCLLGQLLDGKAVAAVAAWLQSKPVADFYRSGEASYLPLSDARHPESHVANHALEDVLEAPSLLSLANRPDVLALVEAHLGCKPTITSLSAWWSYPTGVGPQHAEMFHRDVDDWRFIKLFVYLTDVGEHQGPHAYIAGSARRSELREIRRLTDEEVHATFGIENERIMIGAAGSGFLEDTSGVHKGTPPREGVRLLFQAVYGLTALPYVPRRPVAERAALEAHHGCAFDSYINRHFLR